MDGILAAALVATKRDPSAAYLPSAVSYSCKNTNPIAGSLFGPAFQALAH